jgi:hypothetical protein
MLWEERQKAELLLSDDSALRGWRRAREKIEKRKVRRLQAAQQAALQPVQAEVEENPMDKWRPQPQLQPQPRAGRGREDRMTMRPEMVGLFEVLERYGAGEMGEPRSGQSEAMPPPLRTPPSHPHWNAHPTEGSVPRAPDSARRDGRRESNVPLVGPGRTKHAPSKLEEQKDVFAAVMGMRDELPSEGREKQTK